MGKSKSTRKHKRVTAIPSQPTWAAHAGTPALSAEADQTPTPPAQPLARKGGRDRTGLILGTVIAAIILIVLLIVSSGGSGEKEPSADQAQQGSNLAGDAALAGIDPNDIQALMRRGKELYDQNRFDDAARVYQQAIRLRPDNQAAHSNLGSAYFRLQRLDEALQSFREAVRLNPNDAEARQNLGAGLAAQGSFDAAISEYLQAVALKPDLAPAHYSLGVLYQEQGNKDKAVAELQRYLELGQDEQLRRDAQQRLQTLGVK